MARTFYRVVKSDPPTLADFTSNLALGRKLRRPTPEARRLWDGLSVSGTERQARLTARRFRYLGHYIAELSITENTPIRWEQTIRPVHYTLWGQPELLLQCVVSVVPV